MAVLCTSTAEKPSFKAISWPFSGTTTQNQASISVFNGVPESPSELSISSPTIQALTRVRELGTYEDGWYLPDSLGPNTQTVKDAEAFIRSMTWNTLKQPFIGLAEDGEISFLWENPKVEIDLGFYGTGTYSYYAKFSDGTECLQGKVPATQPLPEDILACLIL